MAPNGRARQIMRTPEGEVTEANPGIAVTSCCDYALGMFRTQIRLTEKQSRRIKVIARRRKISMAAVIREFLDAGLKRKTQERRALWDRAFRFVGAFSDREGARDVARRHDDYLAEAYR